MKTTAFYIVPNIEILYVIGLNSGIKINLTMTECGILTNYITFETYSLN